MMPAATHFDPVVGVDIHMVQPSGPVPPTPIPHPYIGIVFDPFDYLPIIGSTVKINGMHRAIAGTAGKALPKHFPIGGTFVPPLPADVHENFMGSSTVQMDHDAAAYMALPCLSCQSIGMPPPPRQNPKKKTKVRSLVLPTSVVLPIPKGVPVLIGGSPTVSLFALAFHLVGPLAKAIRKAKAFRKGAAAFRKARRRAFRNMKPGFLKCKVLRAEPVDVVTGEVVVDQQDFELPGRIPMRWTRHYRSGSTRRGICGVGWETPADARLEPQADGGVVFHDGAGVASFFDALPDAEPVMEPVDGGRLYRLDRHYAVELKGGLTYYFELPAAPAAEIPVAAIVDRCRNSLHFVRDRDGLREVVESAGRRLICSSEQGLLRSITLHHPDFPERRILVRFAYDGGDNLTAVYDALGHPYTFGWDDRHRLVRHTNRTGLSFYYEYDPESRCVHSWGDGGLYDYHFAYDPIGRFTNLTDSLGHPWAVEYDDRHLITRETDPLGGVTSYAYDEAGRTVAVADPAGRVTSYVYDERGNVLELVRPDGITIKCEFDRDDQPIRFTDPNGAVWEHTWDDRGLPMERIAPDGGRWEYGRTAAGDLVSIVHPDGARWRFGHDRYGLMIAAQAHWGLSCTLKRDTLGLVTDVVDPRDGNAGAVFDLKGRITSSKSWSGSVVRYDHDEDDRLVRIDYEDGRTLGFSYSGLGELAEVRQPDGSTIRYEYDSEERLLSVYNEAGKRHSMARDALGRIVREIDYWDGCYSYELDSLGNVLSSTDPLGRSVKCSYDIVGRLRRRAFDDDVELFEYNNNDQITAMANSSIKISRQYDVNGRLVFERQNTFEIRNVYDQNGRRVSRSSSFGNHLTTQYDMDGQISNVYLNARPLYSPQYNEDGMIVSETLGDSLVYQRYVDLDGYIIGDRLFNETGNVVDRHYVRDFLGNVSRLLETRQHESTEECLSYDLMSRVTGWQSSVGRGRGYSYDASGVRCERGALETLAGGFATEADGKRFVFDSAGNLVRRDSAGGSATFCWNAMNRLVEAATEGGDVVRFLYDPLGRRVTKSSSAGATEFYWDGDRLLGECRGDQQAPRELVYRGESFEPLACVEGGISFFDIDAVGLVRGLFDEEGKELVGHKFTGIGGRLEPALSQAQPLTFQNQYLDEETGLAFTRCRYFAPELAMFISRDPLGLAAGHNYYLYGPNVWTWIDPFGLSCYWDARPRVNRWRDRATGRFTERPGDPSELVYSGRVDHSDIQAWARQGGLRNGWVPDPGRFPSGGFSYDAPRASGGYEHHVHGHGADPNAPANSNAGQGPTATFERTDAAGNPRYYRQAGDGSGGLTPHTWGNRNSNTQMNTSHVPMDGSPY